MNNNIEKSEAEIFAGAVQNAEGDLYITLIRYFNTEMHRAVDHGRICTPERMAILYPIFREINTETDEIDNEWNARRKGAK